jgi:hypothetical protein
VLNRLDFSRIRAQAAGETIDDLRELSEPGRSRKSTPRTHRTVARYRRRHVSADTGATARRRGGKAAYQFSVATKEYIGEGKEKPSTSARERFSPPSRLLGSGSRLAGPSVHRIGSTRGNHRTEVGATPGALGERIADRLSGGNAAPIRRVGSEPKLADVDRTSGDRDRRGGLCGSLDDEGWHHLLEPGQTQVRELASTPGDSTFSRTRGHRATERSAPSVAEGQHGRKPPYRADRSLLEGTTSPKRTGATHVDTDTNKLIALPGHRDQVAVGSHNLDLTPGVTARVSGRPCDGHQRTPRGVQESRAEPLISDQLSGRRSRMATIHLVSQQLDRGDDRPAPDQAQRKRKRNDDGGKLLRHASSLSGAGCRGARDEPPERRVGVGSAKLK